jgi:hypothetical protein
VLSPALAQSKHDVKVNLKKNQRKELPQPIYEKYGTVRCLNRKRVQGQYRGKKKIMKNSHKIKYERNYHDQLNVMKDDREIEYMKTTNRRFSTFIFCGI